jgi:hypothetical protein
MELAKKPSVVQQNNSKTGMLWEIAVRPNNAIEANDKDQHNPKLNPAPPSNTENIRKTGCQSDDRRSSLVSEDVIPRM